ncbi:MAG: hypothetical protein ACSLEN_10905 [Candidatus Malihini olakiniferum]
MLLSLFDDNVYFVMSEAFLWRLGFGGGATLFQTASTRTAGNAADIAQSLMLTIWNMAIAGDDLSGGLLLDQFGILSIPVVLKSLLIFYIFIIKVSKVQGFSCILN